MSGARMRVLCIPIAALMVGCGSTKERPAGISTPRPTAIAQPVPAEPPDRATVLQPPADDKPAPPAPPPPPPPAPEPIRTVFPSVRVDRAAHAVEFDGEIIQDGRKGAGLVTYLEVLACRPNSREHESIVLTQALPSHVHAALLLAGAEPGKPGTWSWDQETKVLTPQAPTGTPLTITLVWSEGGTTVSRPLTSMAKNLKTGATLGGKEPPPFLFTGSGFLKRSSGQAYAADVSGTVVGLCTFGDEPVAWPDVLSPEEQIDDPVWIVNPDKTPPNGTKVVVRIQRAEPPASTPVPPPHQP